MKMLRERLNVPLIVDAGLGLPSHACSVMEWGYDAVLLNTAVALSEDPWPWPAPSPMPSMPATPLTAPAP